MAAASLVVGLKSLAVLLAGASARGFSHAALTWFRVKRVPVVVTV